MIAQMEKEMAVMNSFTEAMAIVGFFTLLGIVILFVIIALDKIDILIYEKKREYQYKHRFDKPPKAKCYCIDCVSYRNGFCYLHKFHIADNWFCRNAIPIMQNGKSAEKQ